MSPRFVCIVTDCGRTRERVVRRRTLLTTRAAVANPHHVDAFFCSVLAYASGGGFCVRRAETPPATSAQENSVPNRARVPAAHPPLPAVTREQYVLWWHQSCDSARCAVLLGYNSCLQRKTGCRPVHACVRRHTEAAIPSRGLHPARGFALFRVCIH